MRDIVWKVFHYSPSFITTKTQLMYWLLGLYSSVKYRLLSCHRAVFCSVFVYCDLNDHLPSVLHDISQCGKDFPQLLINGVISNLIMLLSYYAHWQDLLLHYFLPVLHPPSFLYFLFLNKYKYPSTNC